jgi:hypothetical protein
VHSAATNVDSSSKTLVGDENSAHELLSVANRYRSVNSYPQQAAHHLLVADATLFRETRTLE